MPSRRTFLGTTLATFGILTVPWFAVYAKQLHASAHDDVFKGEDVFNRIMAKADAGKWRALPIGDLMGKIAQELIGTPYQADTLELSPDREFCCVNLTALDCVTFFETTLAFARMLKKGGRTPTDLVGEVSFMRYRGGVIGDYSSRLHYMSDWFSDNESKHVVILLSDLPGAERFTQKVSSMSSHPASSRQLVAHPELIAKIKHAETAINNRSLKFIPMDKIAAVEPLLKTGDVVAVCTSLAGLDVVHTGLVFRGDDGVAHFMDATSKKRSMKVTIEPGPISGALNWSKNLTGAIFARPLEPVITK
jgi:Protein of unknown function (DUF1460)